MRSKILWTAFLLMIVSICTFAGERMKLVILHTNDTHSQVEPTEKSSLPTANLGGYARRMGVISKIREREKNVLLLDAGDFSQGTPFFNFYNGRIEIDALNRMKYDAVTLGNHEFDNGMDTLSVVLKNAQFPVLSSNYSVEKTVLDGMVKPYIVLNRGGIKIGILALNVNPKGLIFEKNYKGMIYLDPVERAIEVSVFLKKKEKCDVIICLSHLGADSAKHVVNDYEIARKTRFIDVIIGGHSHSLLTNVTEKNAVGKPVIIGQMAKSGFFLGEIDLDLERK
jgi:5''-nucleotidase/2'',3''-cyclic phosphodiesterase and related esterases